MKKRLWLIFLFATVLLPYIAHAEKTKLYDKWTKSGDSFSVGDFKLKATWAENTVLLKIDDKTFSIAEGNCVTSKPLVVCYNESRLTKDGKVVPDTIHDSNVDHEMRLLVYGYLAKLEISREYESTSILVSESADVDVSIKNTGDSDADDVAYSETYPDTVNITDVSGCDLDKNEITWKGMIRKGQSQKCTYMITALEEDAFTSKATAEYNNAVDDAKVSQSTRLTIPEPPLEIITKADKTSLSPGDEAVLIINLTDNEDTTININSLKLGIPQGLEMTDSGSLSKSGAWSGKLDKSISFRIMLKAVRTGRYYVTASVIYDYDGHNLKGSERTSFNIKNDLEIELDGEIASISTGTPGQAALDLSNAGTKPLQNIRYRITSDMPGFEAISSTIASLGRNNNQEILDRDITANETGAYTIHVDVTYQNEFKETFTENFTRDMMVKAGKKQKTDVQAITGSGNSNETGNSSADLGQAKQTAEYFPTTDQDSKKSGLFIIAGVIVLALILLYARHLVRSR